MIAMIIPIEAYFLVEDFFAGSDACEISGLGLVTVLSNTFSVESETISVETGLG